MTESDYADILMVSQFVQIIDYQSSDIYEAVKNTKEFKHGFKKFLNSLRFESDRYMMAIYNSYNSVGEGGELFCELSIFLDKSFFLDSNERKFQFIMALNKVIKGITEECSELRKLKVYDILRRIDNAINKISEVKKWNLTDDFKSSFIAILTGLQNSRSGIFNIVEFTKPIEDYFK